MTQFCHPELARVVLRQGTPSGDIVWSEAQCFHHFVHLLKPTGTQAVLTKSALLRKKILSIVPAVVGQDEHAVKSSRAGGSGRMPELWIPCLRVEELLGRQSLVPHTSGGGLRLDESRHRGLSMCAHAEANALPPGCLLRLQLAQGHNPVQARKRYAVNYHLHDVKASHNNYGIHHLLEPRRVVTCRYGRAKQMHFPANPHLIAFDSADAEAGRREPP